MVMVGLLQAISVEAQQDKVSLLVYGRLISDASGQWRVDENLVLTDVAFDPYRGSSK